VVEEEEVDVGSHVFTCRTFVTIVERTKDQSFSLSTLCDAEHRDYEER